MNLTQTSKKALHFEIMPSVKYKKAIKCMVTSHEIKKVEVVYDKCNYGCRSVCVNRTLSNISFCRNRPQFFTSTE